MTFAWEKHRFTDLVVLGERARNGNGAFESVTIQQGEHLLTLLAEAVQYREAHAHSQQLRAAAEQENVRLRGLIKVLCSDASVFGSEAFRRTRDSINPDAKALLFDVLDARKEPR